MRKYIVQAFPIWKHDFDVWVGGDGLDMYQQLEGGFGSMLAILPILGLGAKNVTIDWEYHHVYTIYVAEIFTFKLVTNLFEPDRKRQLSQHMLIYRNCGKPCNLWRYSTWVYQWWLMVQCFWKAISTETPRHISTINEGSILLIYLLKGWEGVRNTPDK